MTDWRDIVSIIFNFADTFRNHTAPNAAKTLDSADDTHASGSTHDRQPFSSDILPQQPPRSRVLPHVTWLPGGTFLGNPPSDTRQVAGVHHDPFPQVRPDEASGMGAEAVEGRGMRGGPEADSLIAAGFKAWSMMSEQERQERRLKEGLGAEEAWKRGWWTAWS